MLAAARPGIRRTRQGRYVSDTFGGPAGPLGGTAAVGGVTWEDVSSLGSFYPGGGFSLDGLGAVRAATVTGVEGDSAAVLETGLPDGFLQVQILDGIDVPPGYAGLLFRATDTNNCWLFYTNGTSAYLNKYVAGSNVNVWSTSLAPVYGDCLGVELVGTTIKCYLNTTLLHAEVDGHNNNATRHGIWNTTYHLGSVTAAALANFTFTATAQALPPVPTPVLVQQQYAVNGVGATSQTVSLPSSVISNNAAVLVVYEYPASASTTAVSGLGATWTQAVRLSNGAGNSAMSVWVGKGCVGASGAAGKDVTVTSSASQTNEVNLSAWSGVTGNIVGSGSAQALVTTTVQTGGRTATTGRLMIGGVLTNTTPMITWTDSPGPWTGLTGSADFFPAYKVIGSHVSHGRSGAASVSTNYVGEVVEIS